MKTTITFEVDTGHLMNATDEQLACLWHVAQGNPAPYGDEAASVLVGALSAEIITRWLAGQPPRLHTHSVANPYVMQMMQVGDFSGPDGRFVVRAKGGAA
jgi:hypothetical protein